MKSFKWLGTAILAGFACLSISAAQAAPVVSNPTFTSGDLTFDTFTVSVTHFGQAFPNANDQVNVNQIPGTPSPGLEFSSGFIAQNNAFSDAAISYIVRGATAVTSVGLSFDGTFLGQAIASVTETIWADAARTIQIGQAYVSCAIAGCSLSDVVTLSGSYDTLYITKDINVSAFEPGDRAQTSIINQTFNPTPVPEPATLALFGTGLAALGLARRMRKAA
jgi:hypothetical protein